MTRLAKAMLLTALLPGGVAGAWAAEVRSPEIHGDGRVTFRLHAPLAKHVAVGGQFSKGKPLPMARGDDGMWSLTTGPFEPDLHVYGFAVDGGKPSADPANPLRFERRGSTLSFLDVPGDVPRFIDRQAVPLGQVHRHRYPAKAFGQERTMVVYTPPEYRADSARRYPVLYLLQGGGDTAEAWVQAGRVHTMLDNLIAQKKARPMIVVMPDGRGVSPYVRKGKAVDRTKNFDEFEASMLRDVVPFVEKNYRASARREDRAVAGFSVGAALARRIGLRHLDRFTWVGLLSGGTRLAEGFETTLKPRLAKPEETNKQLGLLWISGPPKGSAKNAAHPFFAKLNQAGIRYESRPDRFGHSYRTCRHILHHDFLPQLFQKKNW